MKRLFEYLFLVLLYLLLGLQAIESQEKVKGGYHKCQKYLYDFKFDTVDIKSKSLRNVIKYDDKGNMIEEVWYKSNGSIDWKHIFKYDDKGNMIELVCYDKLNEPEYKYVYIYTK